MKFVKIIKSDKMLNMTEKVIDNEKHYIKEIQSHYWIIDNKYKIDENGMISSYPDNKFLSDIPKWIIDLANELAF